MSLIFPQRGNCRLRQAIYFLSVRIRAVRYARCRELQVDVGMIDGSANGKPVFHPAGRRWNLSVADEERFLSR